jgi:predicted RNA-binding protein YlqC (UPF0109 family)
MKEFIEYLVKNLVDQPNEVEVLCSEGEKGWLFQIKVSPEDVGKVIGRKGMTIKALRTIVISVYARLGHRIQLEILE